jgi:hypothetical protein
MQGLPETTSDPFSASGTVNGDASFGGALL